jgi:hypothetical protein
MADRRAVVYNAIQLIRYALLTGIVIAAVLSLTALTINIRTDTRAAQLVIYEQSLLRSPGGFHAVDASGRSDLHTVDMAKVTDSTLDAMMLSPGNTMAAGKVVVSDKTTLTSVTAYWNRKWYDIYSPVAGEQGSGGSVRFSRVYPVLVVDSANAGQPAHAGELTIELVMPS